MSPIGRENKKNRYEVYSFFHFLFKLKFFFIFYPFSLEAYASIEKRFMGHEAHTLDVLQIMRRIPFGANGFSFAPRGDYP